MPERLMSMQVGILREASIFRLADLWKLRQCLRIRACLSMYIATVVREASVWQQGLLSLDLKRW